MKTKFANINTVAIAAIVYNQAPADKPIAAVAHMFAAVVSHFVFNQIFIIAQAQVLLYLICL